MVGIYPSPLHTLAAFALTFAAGAVAAVAWQWHGRRMSEAGRREAASAATA